jgi:signal transduction histidine kinase
MGSIMKLFSENPVFRRALLFVSAGTIMALFASALLYPSVISNSKESSMSPRQIVEWQLIWWYEWVLLTPVVLKLAERFRLRSQNWPRTLVIHLAGSYLITETHLFLYVSICRIIGGIWWSDVAKGTDGSYFTVAFKWFTSMEVNFQLRLLVYFVILMISHAVYYYRRYQEETLENSRLEMQLAQAQIQALKMQLQPHFLFNTLHSLSALLYTNTRAAEEMISRLIDFLNLTLQNSGEQLVTLEKELQFLKTYLEIEQVRFQDRLSVSLEIEPQTLSAQVPNLIMQPIVENAIRHGIAPMTSPGTICIRSRKIDGMLQLQIQDNGAGIPENGNGVKSREGLGLANTKSRLTQLYGRLQKMELSRTGQGGLLVTLEIPFALGAQA